MYGSGELKFIFATYRFAYLIILTATSQIYKGHGALMIQIMGDLEPVSLKIKRTGGVANRIINTAIAHIQLQTAPTVHNKRDKTRVLSTFIKAE